MSDDSDILSHFAPLDELIQVVYQGSARFVILSSVDDASWTVHVGLTGDEGRWWRGRWTDKDVRNTVVRIKLLLPDTGPNRFVHIQGQKVSSILLESFVEKMANAFVQGNVTVGEWSPARGAEIELVIGTTAKTPIRIPLNELSSEDAAVYAIKVFTEIALQAQSRKCRLHPSGLQTSAYEVPPKAVPTASGEYPNTPWEHAVADMWKEKTKEKDREHPKAASGKKRKADLEEAEGKIEALKAELEKTKRQQGAIMTEPSKLLPKNNNGSSAPSKPKGASLANPTKKARKYRALEFESDDE
uniref:Squalene epoxidase n=1 Tax=Ganoderma boninense TaxID=34458 RepID=A0A5K1JX28_9APHY|nr:Squalene epoxidase [Ganoderma boninense]